MGTRLKFIVPESCNGKLLRDFLRTECEVTSTLLKSLKQADNGIMLNNERVTVIVRIHTGDNIELNLHEDTPDIKPVELPFKILYEDEHLLVAEKPPFMAVHPVHGHIDDTLANACAYHAEQMGEKWVFRAVNRLDRDTSGAVLIAKNAYSAPILTQSAKKKYIAVCEGIIEESGTVDKPIRLKEGHTIERETGEGGVYAVTHYKPIEISNGHTLAEFELETGRTHQIRVHMASIGHPLAGDDMYGGSLKYISRQALHCTQISFKHPVTKEAMIIQSDLPTEFYSILARNEK